MSAPRGPELTTHYGVLTLPSTFVLDTVGVTRAFNYGFEPLDRLLEQADAALSRGGE